MIHILLLMFSLSLLTKAGKAPPSVPVSTLCVSTLWAEKKSSVFSLAARVFLSGKFKHLKHLKLNLRSFQVRLRFLKVIEPPKLRLVWGMLTLFFFYASRAWGTCETPDVCTKASSPITPRDLHPGWKVQIFLNFLENPWNIGSDSRGFMWFSLSSRDDLDQICTCFFSFLFCALSQISYTEPTRHSSLTFKSMSFS